MEKPLFSKIEVVNFVRGNISINYGGGSIGSFHTPELIRSDLIGTNGFEDVSAHIS